MLSLRNIQDIVLVTLVFAQVFVCQVATNSNGHNLTASDSPSAVAKRGFFITTTKEFAERVKDPRCGQPIQNRRASRIVDGKLTTIGEYP